MSKCGTPVRIRRRDPSLPRAPVPINTRARALGRGGEEAGGEDGGGRGGARVRVVGLGTVVHGVVARVEEGVEHLPCYEDVTWQWGLTPQKQVTSRGDAAGRDRLP